MGFLYITPTTKIKILTNRKKFYTSFVHDKPTMYSFMNNKSAFGYKKFLTQYKNMYGTYPCISNNKSVPDNSLDDYISIKETEVKPAQNTCLLLNLGLIGITEFDYELHNDRCNLEFNAIDLIGIEHKKIINSPDIDNFFMIMKIL